MIVTLEKLKTSKHYHVFKLPDVIEFLGTTFKMTSPANLMRALNKFGKTLNDVFDVGTMGDMRIHRRCLWVTRNHEERENDFRERERRKRLRACAVCGVECERSFKMIGTCSDLCRQQKLLLRNEAIKHNHWRRSNDASAIDVRRIKTRKNNDVVLNRTYVPWNKGKVGVYSDETLELIREASRRQFALGKIKKTRVESVFEKMLINDLKVNYVYSFMYMKRQFDFYLPEHNLVIEVQGDFWHGNPRRWGTSQRPLRDHQKMKRLDDFVKRELAERHGLLYVEFWEFDIMTNPSFVIEQMRGLLK